VANEYGTQDRTHLKGTKGIKGAKGNKATKGITGIKGTKEIKGTTRFSILHRKVNRDKFYFSWIPLLILSSVILDFYPFL
jgi:hypothetical protein